MHIIKLGDYMYIGIIGRLNNNKITYSKEIIDIIYKYHCIPLSINLDFKKDKMKNIIKLINMCDGFILQGGDKIYNIDKKIVKYLYKHDIPTLGICLGMQTMCSVFKGKLKRINNHYSLNKRVHPIYIKKNTILYEILGKKKIMVNSRHHSTVKKTNLNVSSYYNNIESVEDNSKKCFIGVQWHPESLTNKNSRKLFNYFFSTIK